MNNFINNEYLSVVGGSLEAEMYCLDNQRRKFKNYSWEGGGGSWALNTIFGHILIFDIFWLKMLT